MTRDEVTARLEAELYALLAERNVQAAEITRLRDGIKEAEKIVHDSGRLLGEAHHEITQLRIENAALRRALELKPRGA
jgi:chromosome segregation ATPase